DLSAKLYLCYDAAHLYLAGEVRDQSLVASQPGDFWNAGDVVEVFLDFRRRDPSGRPLPEPGQRARPLGPDQPQVFLMPLNPGRRWGVVKWKESLTRPTGADLTGIVVAGRKTPTGYVFEARLPFHNFFAPEDGPTFQQVDFNVALDDFDEGTERYQYMTWTGTNPTKDARNLGTIVFDGPVPLAAESPGGLGLNRKIVQFVPYALASGVLLVLLLLVLRRASAMKIRPRFQRLLRVAGVVLLIAGTLLPGLLGAMRERGVRARLDRAADMLAEELPKMERGTLGSYLGGQRDRPLLDLLSGRAIERRPFYSHVLLSDLAPGQFGPGPLPYPRGFFDVRPYWIPLPRDEQQRFAFPEPLGGRKLNVVVARPVPAVAPSRSGFQLELAFRLEGEDGETTRLVDGFGETTPTEAFGEPGRLMAYATVELPGRVRSLGIKAFDAEDLVLVGLTVVPDEPGQRMLPLNLGQPSMTGVPSDLRDRYPEDAGIELRRRGSKAVVQMPDGQRTFDRMWLFYRAIDPGFLVKIQKGQEVCRVTAHFAGDKHEHPPVTLRHQETMMYERLDANQEKEPAADVPAKVAFRWREEDQAQRINLVYEVDLPDGAELESLEFENIGPYPVRFRSVVFGNDEPGARLDPNDSPLEPALGKVRLRKVHRAHATAVDFGIYRNGYLVEDGVSTGAADMRLTIPLAVRRLGGAATERLVEDDTRVLERFLPLTGEGWAGAMLAMRVKDPGFGAHQRWASLTGLFLVLLSMPLLLLLFSDALAWISNLRLRLMLVVSVATLVPLGVLFVFLVGVLETGHENEARRNMQQAVAMTRSQLDERAAQLLSTARTWLADLDQDRQRLVGNNDVDAVRDVFANTLGNQLPPDWNGGFLRLDFRPEQAEPPSQLPAFSTFVGNEALRQPGTPLRATPGPHLSWGIALLGVRCDNGPLSLTVGRPLDAQLLGEVSPLAAVLCDAKGYPVATAGGPAIANDLRQATAAAGVALRETGKADLRVHQAAGQEWLGIYEVLRDAAGTPRAILGLLDQNREATLELGLGRVPVRVFFLLVAAILLVLALVLASVVTTRITRPIEDLEEGAEALRRGELDVRVAEQEGGQLGRLTRTFNQMAQDLRGRIRDLGALNVGIRDLTSGLDLDQVVQSVIAIFGRHGPADRVRVLLLDRERDRVEVFGKERREVDRSAPDVATLLKATAPMTMPLAPAPADHALPALFAGFRVLLSFPLVLAGQVRGSILLLFESAIPAPVNLELLTTMAAQTVTAIENARLYRHAVEDLDTGAYVKEYFRRRVVQSVEEAHRENYPLALVGLRLLDEPKLQEALGAAGYGRYLERICGIVRRQLPDAMLCRSAEDALEVLLVGLDALEVEARVHDLRTAVAVADLGRTGPPRLHHAVVTFPADGASAEFLFHALEARLKSPEPSREQSQDDEPAVAAAEDGVVLSSPKMAAMVRVLRKVAPTELTVLLLGETGTGKEVFANLIHKWSKRAKGPLVKVHCAALTESLLQSELFGHEKGAFTGAVARKIGRFEQAGGGTLFLDEIGEVSLDTQVKLLRVLQEREIDRVGGMSPVPVDVRVVAATNQNIRAMVTAGTFREDLYYRLQGMVVTVPPLRERKQEIPGLLQLFLAEAVAEGHTAATGFSTDAMDELFRREWPGNIRELRNTVFRAMVLCAEGEVQRQHLLGILTEDRAAGAAATTSAAGQEPTVLLPRPELRARAQALRGRLQRLYRLIAKRGTLAAQDYVDAAGVSSRTGLRDLAQLLELGLVERVGKRRGARYRLVASGEIREETPKAHGEKT
ncbi:MAG: sigma 54-interacting transcriptional regulator, partial [Planctomycetota bacterium]